MRRMAIMAAALLLLAVGSPGSVGADDAPRFVSVIEDLPLMPGLEEDETQAMAFDSPQGRILQAYATGDVDEDDVLRFYAATLPQLGWRQTGPGAFVREREILKVEFPADPNKGSRLGVRFALAPAPE